MSVPVEHIQPRRATTPLILQSKSRAKRGRGVGGEAPPRSGGLEPPQVRIRAPSTTQAMIAVEQAGHATPGDLICPSCYGHVPAVHPPWTDPLPTLTLSSRTAWRAHSPARDGFTRSRGFSPWVASLDRCKRCDLGSQVGTSPRLGQRDDRQVHLGAGIVPPPQGPIAEQRSMRCHLAAPRLAQRHVVALRHVRSIRFGREPRK